MSLTTLKIDNQICYVGGFSNAEYIIIQPIGNNSIQLVKNEIDIIKKTINKPFKLVALNILDWNLELTPWTAPPVFGNIAFGNGGESTLKFITEKILPIVLAEKSTSCKILIGGYSLAGLFALWAGCVTDCFDGIAACSPSVWYPKWIEFAAKNKINVSSVYLSLGDKEDKTKNLLIKKVGVAILHQHEILLSQGINSVFEWNSGNHFTDSDKRTAKGFVWLMKNL